MPSPDELSHDEAEVEERIWLLHLRAIVDLIGAVALIAPTDGLVRSRFQQIRDEMTTVETAMCTDPE